MAQQGKGQPRARRTALTMASAMLLSCPSFSNFGRKACCTRARSTRSTLSPPLVSNCTPRTHARSDHQRCEGRRVEAEPGTAALRCGPPAADLEQHASVEREVGGGARRQVLLEGVVAVSVHHDEELARVAAGHHLLVRLRSGRAWERSRQPLSAAAGAAPCACRGRQASLLAPLCRIVRASEARGDARAHWQPFQEPHCLHLVGHRQLEVLAQPDHVLQRQRRRQRRVDARERHQRAGENAPSARQHL